MGTWIAASGGAELIYVLRPNRTYKYAAVLLQQREAGLFNFKISTRGTVTVDGQDLILHPKSGTQEVKDPDLPSRNSKRPVDKSPQRYQWAVDRSESGPRLRLTDASGMTIPYRKQ